MSSPNIAYDDLMLMARNSPHTILNLEFLIVDSYEKWVSLINRAIDLILGQLAENPELQQKRQKEDQVTIQVINMLKMLSLDADHDAKVGGHTDILIRGGRDNYMWVGEAKWDDSNSWLYKGFQQLVTRYSTGGKNQDEGGLIIYVETQYAKDVIDKWRAYLIEQLPNIEIVDCPSSKLAFFSKHKHERTGLPYKTRHSGVALRFSPQDGTKPKAR